MTDTIKYLRQFVTPEMLSSNEDDLANSYRLTKDDRLIAALFIKLQLITESIITKYTSVEKETAISFTLTMLEDISSTFDKNKKVKFKTYYINSLKRLMYGLLETALRKKRVCTTEVISFSTLIDNNSDSNNGRTIQDLIDDKFSNYEKSDIELFTTINDSFDPLTAKVIICMAQGYNRPEIANILGIDVQLVRSIINNNKDALRTLLK